MNLIVSRLEDNHASTLARICNGACIAVFNVLMLVIVASCSRTPERTEAVNPQSLLGVRDEQFWIVDSIVRDIADMAVYANNPKDAPLPADALLLETRPADVGGYHYIVTIHLPGEPEAVQLPVDITGAVWASATYQPIARALLERLKLVAVPDSTAINETPIPLLISPVAEGIQRQNERVAKLLTEHPLAPEAHEQAALIIATLGQRENSGEFWDTRGICNRAAAHLAFARAIRGDQSMSDSGELGELLIGLLDDTKKDCEQRIAKLKCRAQAKPELKPWIIFAQLRNRRDWRVLDDPGAASLLERMEYFRARCEAVSPDAASRELLLGSPENIPDWSCILLQFDFSVGDGHVFTKGALKRELQEVREIFPNIRAGKLTPETLAETLNKPPGRAVQSNAAGQSKMIPIDDGMWAHYFQRHLCHIASRTDYFLRKKWSVPDRAAEFETAVESLFAKLTFAPILGAVWTAPHRSDREYTVPAPELLKQHPEWVTSDAWGKISRNGSARAPSIGVWFSPGLPAGTAYCYYGRDSDVPKVKNMTKGDLQKLYDIAPWHYGVALSYMRALYGEKPTPEQFRSILGPYLDFNVAAMRWYAYYVKDDIKEYVSIHQRIAKLDPEDYLVLGRFYREHNMDEEAADAIEAAIHYNADPVAVTHSSGWLVNYYFDHGKKDRALEIAKDAAEVYSRVGLTTMAELQERMGNPKEAESYFEKIKERYDNAGQLIAFYQRQTTLNPNSEYVEKLTSNMRAVFPDGLKSVALADFTEPPKDGIIIAEQNKLLLKCGLKEGSIIVALDGKRTKNLPQYEVVREFTKSPHMELIVFQDGRYQLIKTKIKDRRFGLDFRSWPE